MPTLPPDLKAGIFAANQLPTPQVDRAEAILKEVRPLDFGSPHTQTINDNYLILRNRPPKMPPASTNASYQRHACGGTPPYRYSTVNPSIVTVYPGGLVVATSTGTARITVTDNNGQTACYDITFTGTVRYVELVSSATYDHPKGSINRPDAWGLTCTQMRQFWSNYINESPTQSLTGILGWPHNTYWTTEPHGATDAFHGVEELNARSPNWFNAVSRNASNRPSIRRVNW
ncbi:Ig-like domain-containing protein [Pseudomonas sp. NPDC090233]|uniref:Ig-like domain-containing protein n=1 Tax=Pseudomonas sp. NPDC090233 TaxID=3364479 RepID=UPI00383BB98B